MIVIDASVFVSAIVFDEADFFAKHIYDRIIRTSEQAIAPPIFSYETANVFQKILK